jgi:hypothetical protein
MYLDGDTNPNTFRPAQGEDKMHTSRIQFSGVIEVFTRGSQSQGEYGRTEIGYQAEMYPLLHDHF